jgi:hypothetical protein
LIETMTSAKLVFAARTDATESRSPKGKRRSGATNRKHGLCGRKNTERILEGFTPAAARRNRTQRQKSEERTLFEATNPAIPMKTNTDQNASAPDKSASNGFLPAPIQAKRTHSLAAATTTPHKNQIRPATPANSLNPKQINPTRNPTKNPPHPTNPTFPTSPIQVP